METWGMNGCQGLGGRGEWGVTDNGPGSLVLECSIRYSHRILQIYLNLLSTLKVNVAVCELPQSCFLKKV